MIYNSMITSIQEEDVMSLLEEVELKYEHETIAETGARVVAEHEANWTKFMTAVGLSELNSICEGEIAIYEGARLESLVKKAKGIFELRDLWLELMVSLKEMMLSLRNTAES